MDQDSLVIEQIEVGAEVARRFDSFMPVKVAFWFKIVDGYDWKLCIASDRIDEKTLDAGYVEVLKLIREQNTPYIDLFRIRLVGSSDPLATALLKERERYSRSQVGIRIEGGWFGDRAIEGAYIYPESIVAEPQRASAP